MGVGRFAWLFFSAALIFPSADRAQASHFGSLYVFGDSLSDSGNLFALTGGFRPPSPPYFNGRASNGPVWVESLAPALGFNYTQATNFAIGGAESGARSAIDVGNQIGGFVAGGGTVPEDALTIVWAGNNDFLRNAAFIPPSVLTTQVVTNLGTAIGTLSAFGARSFLIPNLPKFGNTPAVASTALAEPLNQLASLYNTTLHTALIGLEETLGVRIFIMDVEGLFDDAISNPEVYGIANTTVPCLLPTGAPTGACLTEAAADAALFWDALHPTRTAHFIISEFAQATLAMFEQPRVVAVSGYMGPIIADTQRQSVKHRLMSLRTIKGGNEGPWSVYASYRAASGARDDRASAAGFDYDLDLITIGADRMVGSGWAIGAAINFGIGEYDLLDGNETDINTVSGSGYATYSNDSGLYLDLSAGYSANKYKGTRATSFTFRPTAWGKTSGNSVFANMDVGYGIDVGGIGAGAFVGLRYLSSDVSAYAEKGAAMLNLDVLNQRTDGLVGAIGLEVGGSVNGGGYRVAPVIRLSYETELDSLHYGATVQTSTGQLVSIGRGDLSKNRITANAGLGLIGERLSLSVSYQGTVAYSNGKDNGVAGRVSYAF